MPGFKKEERLSKDKEYKKTYQGRSCQNAFFVLYFIPNHKKMSRAGFVIKKKCFKSAVLRNRLKRLLKEVYRLHKSRIKGNFDIVIVAREINFSLNYKEVEKRVMDLFVKAGIINSTLAKAKVEKSQAPSTK